MLLAILISFAIQADVTTCASPDNEPALELKTAAGPTLKLCGFEDHEIKSPKGTRTFSDFVVFAFGAKDPVKIFASEDSETYWVRANGTSGFEVEELWFFSEKPTVGLARSITCTADACAVSEPKCVYKPKGKPFPKALGAFTKKLKAGTLKEEGEELIDQIFAQAIAGDQAAKDFYAKKPEGMAPELNDAFDTNLKKLTTNCR